MRCEVVTKCLLLFASHSHSDETQTIKIFQHGVGQVLWWLSCNILPHCHAISTVLPACFAWHGCPSDHNSGLILGWNSISWFSIILTLLSPFVIHFGSALLAIGSWNHRVWISVVYRVDFIPSLHQSHLCVWIQFGWGTGGIIMARLAAGPPVLRWEKVHCKS